MPEERDACEGSAQCRYDGSAPEEAKVAMFERRRKLRHIESGLMQVTIPNSLSPASAQQQINVLEVNCAAWPTPVVAQRRCPTCSPPIRANTPTSQRAPAELRAVANLAVGSR